MGPEEALHAILGAGEASSMPDTAPGRRWTSGLLARIDRSSREVVAERERRFTEAAFVGNLLVARIDPPLRLSPRERLDAGVRAHDVGEIVEYGHLWALGGLAYLFGAEMACGEFDRWATATGGIGLHRYLVWYDERAHFDDVRTWARELREAYGPLLGDLYQVLLHQDPDILGRIADRFDLPGPTPTRSLWDIAFPHQAGERDAVPVFDTGAAGRTYATTS
jgi:hypothetical protein